jgi:hypothetical protein
MGVVWLLLCAALLVGLPLWAAHTGQALWQVLDAFFRTGAPDVLRERLSGAGGSVRTVGEPDEAGVVDVFWRPSKGVPDPRSLLRILHRRLGVLQPKDAGSASPAAGAAPRRSGG